MTQNPRAGTPFERAIPFAVPENRWSDPAASRAVAFGTAAVSLQLLGSDLTVTNFGGGNTSAKIRETDPLTGETVDVLWVKGSGGDIGSMKLDGFSTLYLDRLLSLEKHVPRPRARRRDGGLPAALHVQPESARSLHRYAAACAICRSPTSTTSIPTRSSRLPHRPAAKRQRARSGAARSAGCPGSGRASNWACGCATTSRRQPRLRGVMLAGHGIICWAADVEGLLREHDRPDRGRGELSECEALRAARRSAASHVAPDAAAERAAAAAELMPRLRGLMTDDQRKVGHF